MSVSNSINHQFVQATEQVIGGLRLVQISYPLDYNFLPDKVPELARYLFLNRNCNSENFTEWWVYQPFWGKFTLQYANDPIFAWLQTQEEQVRHQFGYKGFLTASAFVKNGELICWGIQDVSKHILTVPKDPHWWVQLQTLFTLTADQVEAIKTELAKHLPGSGLDVREVLKRFLSIPSGTAYELNPGSHEDNHSEALALYQFFGVTNEAEFDQALVDPRNQDKLNLLQGSTCYLHGHWWSCADCGRKMAKVGVKSIVFNQQWVLNYIHTQQPISAGIQI